MCATMPSFYSAGDGTQGFMHVRQVLAKPHLQPLKGFLLPLSSSGLMALSGKDDSWKCTSCMRGAKETLRVATSPERKRIHVLFYGAAVNKGEQPIPWQIVHFASPKALLSTAQAPLRRPSLP